uniref:C2H2-type domain-containing protein n=1 Tax=Plectus sambesii TaxID=2011161 RepID=A0A914VF41_9BILA
MDFVCPHPSCSKDFANASGLSRHKREVHPELVRNYTSSTASVTSDESSQLRNVRSRPPQEKRSRTICAECNAELHQQKDLLQHLKEVHQRSDIEIQIGHFNSTQGFDKWLSDVERKNTVRFVTDTGAAKTKQDWSRKYYYCSRSHSSDRQGTGRRAERVSIKSSYRCSSFVSAKFFEDGHVETKFCLQHSGHDIEPAKLPLDVEARELIASYIRDNQTNQWINDKLNKLYEDANDRNFFINRKDIANVRQKYQLHPGRLHEDDMQSVEEWIRRDRAAPDSNEWENFFAYRRASDPSGKDFRLGLMTEGQRDILRKYAHKGVAVDGTHNTTKYGFKLMTLLVLDDRQTGRPVAHFFCPEETTDDLHEFFVNIKERYGRPITTSAFMSDDASQMWTAWERAMGKEATADTKKLLCSWHVLKNWHENARLKIKDKEVQVEALTMIDMLTRISNKEQFRRSLEECEQYLIEKEQSDFLIYFRKHYTADADRLVQWAPSERTDAPFNTNMALERFHRHLKQNYLLQSENRRMDFTIFALVQAASMTCRASLVQMSRSEVGFRQRVTHNRHRRAEEKYKDKLDVVRKVPDHPFWMVQSRTNKDKFYAVEFIKECACDVNVKCRYCSVCFDEFQCDCPDAVKAGISCAHIHAVQMKINQEPATNPRARLTASSSASSLQSEVQSEVADEAAVETAYETAEEATAEVVTGAAFEAASQPISEDADAAATGVVQAPHWRRDCTAMLQLLQGRVALMSNEDGIQFMAALQALADRTTPVLPARVSLHPRPDASNAHALPQRLSTRTEKLRKRKAEKSRKTCRPSEVSTRAAPSDSEVDPDDDEFVPTKQKSLLHSHQNLRIKK